ncbi:zinc finger and BTB domain-containing protein 16-A [Nothobranchius furzeri]
MIQINNTQYFHFLQQANALRRSGVLCDAFISVQSQTFRAHRLVLACASRTLAQQLAQGGDIDSPVHCTLDYFLPHTFQQVLDFTYTQALEVSVKDLHLLLKAAQLLEMQMLADQCRKQLEILETRGEDQTEEREDVKEFKDQKLKQNLIHEDKIQDASPPVEKAGVDPPDVDSPNANNLLKSPRKKPRLSPISATLCSKDSVFTRPTTSGSSFTSPWTLHKNVWESEMRLNTLRRIAENYSNLVSAHNLQSSNSSSFVYPLSLSTPSVLPFFSSRFQSPLQNSTEGYPRFHPHYTQNLYSGSSRVGSMIKRGLLKRKKSNPSQTAETSFSEEPKQTKGAKDCRDGSMRLLSDPVLQASGKNCAGYQFGGRDVREQHETETRGQRRGEKPYQCKHCPKKFSLKHQLDTHHRVHTGEKPFECRLCGQRSRDYSAMIKHLRTHGGAAPYQCTMCLEFCSSLVAMQRHVKSHAAQDFPPNWSINSTYLYISHI